MRHKRFALLAGVLVALNVALWLAPAGLALRQVLVSQLFGPSLVRGEVIESTGGRSTADWRVDRGVILRVNAHHLILREVDTKVQPIRVSAQTHVIAAGVALPVGSLSRGWRVLVTWRAPNGPADTVEVESR